MRSVLFIAAAIFVALVLTIVLIFMGARTAGAHEGEHPAKDGDAHELARPTTPIPVPLERYEGFGGDFTLTDQNGERTSLSGFRGKAVLLFFGYTSCQDICPTTAAKVARVKDKLGDAASEVRFLFISTDPARDSPPRLKSWLGQFDPQFVGLTGTEEEILAVERQYGAYHQQLASAPGSKELVLSHTARVFLIDQKGGVRYMFPAEDSPEAFVDGILQLVRPRPWWRRLIDWVG